MNLLLCVWLNGVRQIRQVTKDLQISHERVHLGCPVGAAVERPDCGFVAVALDAQGQGART